MVRFLLCTSLLITLSAASFCGDSAIPYSLEVLSDGQPILGCARPSCFGWTPNGLPVSPVHNTGAFYSINGHADGFVRDGRASIPAYGPADARFYRPQTATCETVFSSTCAGVNQWVGGIAPLLNVTSAPTALQCCTFEGLLQSEDRGQATLHGGEIVVGGEVFSSIGKQFAFDYIANVAKVHAADGNIQYDISIRRMACPDVPAVSSKPVGAGAIAFQTPNVAVDQPLSLPPAGPEGPQTLVLEEIVQEEAIQLPPGTQFQPIPPPQLQSPPFQPQFVPQAPVAEYYPVYAYGGGNAQWCFTGDMTDWVLAANDLTMEYVRVESWLHRVSTQEAEFNEFATEDGRTIKLTDKHYIFQGDCSRVDTGPIRAHLLPRAAVSADSVRVGDCLYTVEETGTEMREVRVIRADKVTQIGIYAPMTTSGRIIVNGVHASCHNIMQTNTIGSTIIEALTNIAERIFGRSADNVVESPAGLSTILEMADLIMPKNLVIM